MRREFGSICCFVTAIMNAAAAPACKPQSEISLSTSLKTLNSSEIQDKRLIDSRAKLLLDRQKTLRQKLVAWTVFLEGMIEGGLRTNPQYIATCGDGDLELTFLLDSHGIVYNISLGQIYARSYLGRVVRNIVLSMEPFPIPPVSTNLLLTLKVSTSGSGNLRVKLDANEIEENQIK